MKQALCLIASAALLAAGLAGNACADTIKLTGAKNVIALVINPHRAAVEKLTGHTLVVVESGTGNGLVDLANHDTDAAMVAERIDIAVAVAETAGRKLHPSALRMHELLKEDIVFVVHPSNPVTKLSHAQLSDIHTGKISNWSQVGGKDLAIQVYADAPTGGTRAAVRKLVMHGADYGNGVKSLASASAIAEQVPNDERAIGAIGRGLLKADGRTRIVETAAIASPLSLVTVGQPSANVAQVITAFQRAAAGELYAQTTRSLVPLGASD